MRQTWRWFGPADTISIPEIQQTGAEGIVSALHHIAPGNPWPVDEIKKRQAEISHPNGSPSGLAWDVVESVPVSETIKTKTGAVRDHYEAYRQSLRNLAACGLTTVCYNFMPVLDWTRTELAAPMPDGATAMLFDIADLCLFDVFLLERGGARDDYPEAMVESAESRHAVMSDTQKKALVDNIVAGLPGANDAWTLGDVRAHLTTYKDITANQLRQNLVDFLSEVVPTAEEVGIRLCCHPDDPPFPLLGLPRVVSTEDDYAYLMDAVKSSHSGITFCTGSLGVDSNFNPVRFIECLGTHVHFVHLRNTKRLDALLDGRSSFFEAAHLDGDTDMAITVKALMNEQKARRRDGRTDWQIPMRPDHGQAMLADLDRNSMPGYPLIGRMRGLAELRGLMAAYE
ncbi:MAG: mannonate dehydratase [Pseudomonadota bacterium]